ncbi:DUF1254 domain-containing protein [Polymorphum gilvum]|uniref:DUF1254 domain-containing protein n=1 Tax=Polymorphum gilvum (strain LMG 25793 / CGMCC 1.9160 / SL003B-26A1) TaxID=991905 RepID=F2IV34_POLGS|nr:DUF1254 domain-containing protein [Polymorphum gilvum]ADZ71365.1 hypothetical protein SL003B_2942 [Polymorphum gilvum SL003B-26A1]
MTRFLPLRPLLYVLATLLLAGIVHILVVLTVPGHVRVDAFEKLARFGPDRTFNVLRDIAPGSEPLPMLDPAMKHAICRFRLTDGPVHMSASVDSPFWSLGLFNGAGEVVYSLNNRTSGSGELAMLVLSPEQLSILRENPPENLDELIVIETEESDGFALLRAFVPDAAHKSSVDAGLAAARCATLSGRSR